jgi:hypothetical protein
MLFILFRSWTDMGSNCCSSSWGSSIIQCYFSFCLCNTVMILVMTTLAACQLLQSTITKYGIGFIGSINLFSSGFWKISGHQFSTSSVSRKPSMGSLILLWCYSVYVICLTFVLLRLLDDQWKWNCIIWVCSFISIGDPLFLQQECWCSNGCTKDSFACSRGTYFLVYAFHFGHQTTSSSPIVFQRHGEKLSYSWPSILNMLRCHHYSFIPWYMFLFDIYWLLTYIFSSRAVTDASEKDLISLGFQVKLLNYSLLCLA